MNRPPAFNLFLFPSGEQANAMGSVETPPLLRLLRPGTFALWFIVFVAEVMTIVSTGGSSANYLVLLLSTALFACVHVQFWYEESEQGRRVHHAIERMRGRIYEDEATSLPNSRHFVFELRRQMMRSVRNGRGFSLILIDLTGAEQPGDAPYVHVTRALRAALSDGDFIAHLQGAVFAAIALDDGERTAAEKADAVLGAMAGAVAATAAACTPVVSLTGYEGELEVREFLKRAQRDLVSAKARGGHTAAGAAARLAVRAG